MAKSEFKAAARGWIQTEPRKEGQGKSPFRSFLMTVVESAKKKDGEAIEIRQSISVNVFGALVTKNKGAFAEGKPIELKGVIREEKSNKTDSDGAPIYRKVLIVDDESGGEVKSIDLGEMPERKPSNKSSKSAKPKSSSSDEDL